MIMNMSNVNKYFLRATVLAGLWINLSEFARNEWLLGEFWRAHYRGLGLSFVTRPENGVVWLVWGFALAGLVAWLTQRVSAWVSAVLIWLLVFALMWLVLWNLQVLPLGLLPYAIPLSMLETAGAVWICKRLQAVGRS